MSNYEVETNTIDLQDLAKKPRIYKTDNMIYRLTKQDVYRIQNNTTMKKSEYENIQLALKVYINEKEKSILSTRRLTDYIKETYKAPTYSKDLINKVYYTLLSYFYNVPYSKIAELKNLKENENIYNVMSYEEMRYISIMKNDIVETCQKNNFKDEESILKYAKKVATVGRNKFISKYKVDPILLEKGEYNCYEILDFSNYLEEHMKNNLITESTATSIRMQSNQKETQNTTNKQHTKNVDEGREQ